MAQVLLNLGSNIDRERMLCAGLDALSQRFGTLALSSVYESEAVGFRGDPFFNLGVVMECTQPLGELARALRELEYRYGRARDSARFTSRTLDIDILTYGDLVGTIGGVELPRPEILYNAYVLLPLAELVPATCHPVLARSYETLWGEFDRSRQPLRVVDFWWGDKQVSRALEV